MTVEQQDFKKGIFNQDSNLEQSNSSLHIFLIPPNPTSLTVFNLLFTEYSTSIVMFLNSLKLCLFREG